MSTRRAFLGQTVGAAGLLGLGADRAGPLGFLSDAVLPGVAVAAVEPPPETTRLRIFDVPAACLAPQFLAEDLLRAEGFKEIQYVKWTKGTAAGMIVNNEADLTSADAPALVMVVDGNAPVTMLAGLHVGCYELFGNEPIRTIRDLRGKTISVPALRSAAEGIA